MGRTLYPPPPDMRLRATQQLSDGELYDTINNGVAEYANSEGTTSNNAGVRLHRARKAAAKRLTQVCGACAEHKCLDCTCRRSAV